MAKKTLKKTAQKRYQLAKPHIGKQEEKYVLQVLRSGTLSIGPFIDRFEKAFAHELGAKYACAVSSGTSGIHMALIAAGIGPGDEVITSPFSFIASANAILYVGARPVFVDIDPVTYNIDPKEIEKKITHRTRAILPVHIFGQPAQMDVIMKIAKKHSLHVIEDACESLLATYKGKPVGLFGESGVFAFYANKQMTTGEGGMIVTNDKKLDELFRSIRNQGRGSNMQWLDHSRLGYNYRMDEMSAALGLAQVEKLPMLIAKRQQLAIWYTEALQKLSSSIVLPHVGPNATHTWFVYVIQLKNVAAARDMIMRDLANEGIPTKTYLPSIHLFSFYKEQFGYREGDFPLSEKVSAGSLALPFALDMTKRDVQDIVSKLGSILENYERLQK